MPFLLGQNGFEDLRGLGPEDAANLPDVGCGVLFEPYGEVESLLPRLFGVLEDGPELLEGKALTDQGVQVPDALRSRDLLLGDLAARSP